MSLIFIQTTAYFRRDVCFNFVLLYWAEVTANSLLGLLHSLNLATRENQQTFNLFFTTRLEKPQVSLNWVDYYNANKHLYFGVKINGKAASESPHGVIWWLNLKSWSPNGQKRKNLPWRVEHGPEVLRPIPTCCLPRINLSQFRGSFGLFAPCLVSQLDQSASIYAPNVLKRGFSQDQLVRYVSLDLAFREYTFHREGHQS